jgi:hypothetical protein
MGRRRIAIPGRGGREPAPGGGAAAGKTMRAPVLLLLVLLATAPARASHAEESSQWPDRTAAALPFYVAVYDYAGVPAGELREAQQAAEAILRAAGVEAVWVECSLPASSAECRRLGNGRDAALNLLPERMARALKPSRHALGMAVLEPQDEVPGIIAYVFAERVERAARRGGRARAELLGRVMAHELGHLVLGTLEHAEHGIMQAVLGTQGEAPAFTAAQGQAMRGELQVRMLAREARARTTALARRAGDD